MGDNSKIEWTDASWNVVTGCTKVSPGCDFCYAERVTNRFAGPGAFDQLVVHPDRLTLPLRWRRPRKIFVNSMSDVFHDDIPTDLIASMFAVMGAAPHHIFQILTKRHGRMRSMLNDPDFPEQVDLALRDLMMNGVISTAACADAPRLQDGPLPNVWIGVSVEDQKWADIRIPALLDTPAAVRFLSCEPLLGPVSLIPPLKAWADGREVQISEHLHWVIAGGESGPQARPMHPDWPRRLRDECVAAKVAYHYKQWGEWAPEERSRATHLLNANGSLITIAQGTSEQTYGSGSPVESDLIDRGHPGWARVRKVGKKVAGRELDGRTWDEWPKDPSERVSGITKTEASLGDGEPPW